MRYGFMRQLSYTPFSVDLWSEGDRDLDRELGLVTDLELAHRLFEAAAERFPGRVVTLRQVTRLIRKTEPQNAGTDGERPPVETASKRRKCSAKVR